MKKNIYILTALLFILASCEKDRIHYLDHSRWFIYEENDTLVFKSEFLADTYRINEIVNEHEIIDKKEGDEILWVEYEGISVCPNCPMGVFSRDYQHVTFQGKLYPGYSIYYESPAIDYLLGDTLLQDIYVVEDIPIEDTVRHKVKAIYYSDIFGIIRYDMYDDRVYELQIE